MASAWGAAWGTAWGAAWGGTAVVTPPPPVVTLPVWTSADLLRRFKRMAGLPDVNEEDDGEDLYPILAEAEGEVVREIAIRYPHCLYSGQGPTLLTPSADRKTFTFGTDANGNAILPLGWVQISPRKTAFVGDPAYFWREGVDFLDEGTQIRLPGDRSYAGELWGRWIPTPPGISATVEPVLEPADARQLIVIRAVYNYAMEGYTRPDLITAMRTAWDAKFPVWMLNYRRRFRGGGALRDPALWWLNNPDLGRSGG